MTSQMHSPGMDDEGVPIPAAGLQPTTFLGRLPGQFMVWSMICGVSAAPSFVLGTAMLRHPEHDLAMLAGIATFVVAYTLFGSTATAARLRKRPLLRTTLYIGYGIRIAISLLSVTPIFVLDALCGAMSMTLTGLKDSGMSHPVHVFATTLVQGLLLNVLLGCFMAIVYGLLLLVRGQAADRPPQRGLCRACGYDLRASSEICPECGTPIEAQVKLA